MIRYALWTGAAVLAFLGCAEVPVSQNSASVNSESSSLVQFKSRGEMIG